MTLPRKERFASMNSEVRIEVLETSIKTEELNVSKRESLLNSHIEQKTEKEQITKF